MMLASGYGYCAEDRAMAISVMAAARVALSGVRAMLVIALTLLW